MITYIFQVSLSWLVFYGLYHFFLRKETFFNTNRFFLLFALGMGLLLPFCIPMLQTAIESNINYIPTYTLPIQEVGFAQNSTSAITFSWSQLVIIGYILGILYFLSQFLKGIYNIYQLKKSGQIQTFPNYQLIRTDKISTPFSFGKWLFLPQHQLSSEDESQIIQHELVHIQSQHSFDIITVELLSILFWFNPMLRLFHTALKEVHEYAADQHVLRSIPVKNYGQLLLQQAFPDIELRLVHNFNQSQLKNRIKMMTKKRSSKRALLKYAFIVPVLFAVSVIFSAYTFTANSPENGDPVYSEVDQMPTLKGCENSDKEAAKKCSDQKMIQLVYGNVKYPKAAFKNNIEGLAVVSFTVTKEGKVKDVKIVKDVAEGCGQAAHDAVYKMVTDKTQWNPGVHKGKKVNVSLKLPVRFKITKDKE